MNAAEARDILQLQGRVGAETCFGAPAVGPDGRIAIPCAEVIFGLGFGWGGDLDQGGGTGGGTGARSRPVAVIEIGPNGVRVHPIEDRTAILVARLALAAAAVAILSRIVHRFTR